MNEKEIQSFWQQNPCGAQLVGDIANDGRQNYEDFFRRYDEYRYTKEPHIIKNLDGIDFNGKCVLEIGLGQGADGEQIARRGAIYSGVDLTDEAVNRTRMRFALRDLAFERIDQASALELPFDDSSFDIVFSHGVLHHIPEIGKAQTEIARVLRPGGRLVVMLYAKWSLNYLLAISCLRRVGLLAMYSMGMKGSGIYADHLKNAREMGVGKYLAMTNFINVSTDGPFNPYSKVYGTAGIVEDFKDFQLVETHKEFMHAPPLPVGRLPLASVLGWHLWVELRTRNKD